MIASRSELHFPLMNTSKENLGFDRCSFFLVTVICFILSRSFEFQEFFEVVIHYHYSTGLFLIHCMRCWLRFSQLVIAAKPIHVNVIYGIYLETCNATLMSNRLFRTTPYTTRNTIKLHKHRESSQM